MAQCSEDSFERVWSDFHANPFDQIYINRRAFEDVSKCHGQLPPGLLVKTPAPSAKHYHVHRDRMFEFLVAHSRVCGH